MSKRLQRPASPEDDTSHVLLGRIVRQGLARASQAGPARLARNLYQSPAGSARKRHWGTLTLGGLAAAGTALFLVLGPGDGREPRALAYLFETRGSGDSNRNRAAAPAGVSETGLASDGVMREGTLRFSDGSTFAVRAGGRARLRAVSAGGARVQMLDGRARAHIDGNRASAWIFEAGPYQVRPADLPATSLELNWLAQRELLLVSVRSGRAAVRGASAGAKGVVLGPGESFLARASDGLARVGKGHVLLDSLAHDDAGPVTAALTALEEEAAAGSDARSHLRATEGLAVLNESGTCRLHETSPLAEALPDPGPVNLASCRHFDAGLTGKDLRARPSAGPWVRPGPHGCLKYSEDARGNRVPDFSHSGYQGGGVAPPRVAVPPGAFALLPGAGGDDTAAIQAAIDAVSALPPDAQGIRGAVELGPGPFTLAGSLRLAVGGVVLRGQGPEGSSATVLRAVGAPRTVLQLGPDVRRRGPGKEVSPVSDVYVPVGARSFTLERLLDLKVGDDIVVHRPKTQRWICAIGADFFPVRRDGKAPRPWKAGGALTFERRITRIEGNRITVDVPLTNALEKEYTQAFVTRLDFPERVSEVGVERLATRAEFAPSGACPSGQSKFVRVNAVRNGWLREVRVEGYREGVILDPPSKWVTVEDVTYQGLEGQKCDQQAFNLGGQQNLITRSRSFGSNLTAVITGNEVEGPNAVVDFLAVGRAVRVRVSSRWSTGILLDNVRVQDSAGQPSGDFDLARGRRTLGWSAVNSVIWNSEADTFSVDDPPTARNWVMGGAVGARSLLGTGTYGSERTLLEPRSLYRAQLAERVGRPQPLPRELALPPSLTPR